MARDDKSETTTTPIQRTRVRAGTLADAVRDVAGVVAGRNTIPILDHVLIVAEASTIELTATNLDMWVVRTLQSDDAGEPDSAEWKAGSKGFALTVAAKQLQAVLAELDPDAMVVLLAPTSPVGSASPGSGSARAGEETRMVLKAGRSRFKLPCLPWADFPRAPDVSIDAGFEIRASQLADHFARVEHAISSEETRYYLNGVFVHPAQAEGEAQTLRFAATDGSRLARLAVDVPEGAASWPAMIVGRLTVALLDKLLACAVKADEDAFVEVAAGKLASAGVVSFDLPAAGDGEVRLIAKTIDGTFPDYGRVIPADPPIRVTIDRGALAQAAKRMGVMTEKKSRILKFAFAADKLTITGQSVELGEGAEEMPCSLDGEGIEIGFDHQYLRDALAAVGATEVVLAMTGPGDPCRIEAVTRDSDEAAPALVQVVMPVRV